jgi:hypothetical protein
LVHRPLFGLTYDECGIVGGMRIGRGNRSTRRKPAPVPLCSPQIPHDLIWNLTRAAPVGNPATSFFLVSLGGVRLSPLGTSATVGLLYQPRMFDDDYGADGGMRIGRGNRNTRRKPAPVPLCPPQIPHDLTWDRIRAAAVGSQRLTA